MKWQGRTQFYPLESQRSLFVRHLTRRALRARRTRVKDHTQKCWKELRREIKKHARWRANKLGMRFVTVKIDGVIADYKYGKSVDVTVHREQLEACLRRFLYKHGFSWERSSAPSDDGVTYTIRW